MAVHDKIAFIQKCITCPIGRTAVCSRCDGAEIDELEKVKFYRHFEAGQSLIRARDEMGYVASVVTGMASLTHTMEDGRLQMTGLLMPSNFLGRPGRTIAAFDVTAITNMRLCCFRRKPFEALLLTMPHLSERLLELALDELDAARDWMLLLGRKTARERVASLLVLFCRLDSDRLSDGRNAGFEFSMPLTRIQMADYLGLTEETVSRQFSWLKRDGVIETLGRNRLQATDFALLLEESGDDQDGCIIA